MAETEAPATPERFPSVNALPRSVLVDNISPLATSAALEDFFSFCGTIEEHRLRTVDEASGIQQAVVIFSDERARENALVMNRSSIVDMQVTITTVSESYDFNADPSTTGHGTGQQQQAFGLFGGGLAAFGGLFQGVGSAVAAEVEKASKVIDEATDTGVLKTAKDQMVLARKKTTELAENFDNRFQVRENVKNAASAVATSTTTFASQVDRSLHISENTGMLADRARENPTVNNGIRAVQGGFQTLLAQTGLKQNNNTTQNEGGSHAPASAADTNATDSQSLDPAPTSTPAVETTRTTA